MIYPVYTVRDTKVNAFDTQFIVQVNDEVAKRGFSMMINSPNTIPGFAPADFELYKIADFDTESGKFIPTYPAQFIINGGSVVSEK